MSHRASELRVISVPLFPLPNVVLYPRAVLPLHVFEERYKMMVADALAGDKRIAMALLRPGWEQCYYDRPAIEPIVCIGKIVSHQKLPDGKYNLLLQGCRRGQIVSEIDGGIYRSAEVELLLDHPSMEIDLCNERQRLISLFMDSPLSALPITGQLRQILSSPISTGEVADLLAFTLLEDVALKQSLLAERDVSKRVARVVRALEAILPAMSCCAHRRAGAGAVSPN